MSSQIDAFANPERMATLGVPRLRIDVMTSVVGRFRLSRGMRAA